MSIVESVSGVLFGRAKRRPLDGGVLALASGLGLGAGLMFVLDPDGGRRRRARARDRVVHAKHVAADLLDKGSRDLAHRLEGVVVNTRARFGREEVVPDDVLVQRVRAQIGRLVAHPWLVQVLADHGTVVLRGTVQSHELTDVLARVRAVPGVKHLIDQLTAQAELDEFLGGARTAGPPATMFNREVWPPAAQLVAGTGGLGLALWGAARRDLPGLALGAAGATLLLRASRNQPLPRLVRLRRGPDVVRFHRTVNIRAPVEQVFAFWTWWENHPRFMPNLHAVTDLGNGHVHWVATGPGGVPVEWESKVTQLVPQKLVAWRSLPGSAIETEGRVHFEPGPGGGTRLDVHLSYKSPAGAVGHLVASLFRRDPEHWLTDGLVRLKGLLEQPRAARPHQDDFEVQPQGASAF